MPRLAFALALGFAPTLAYAQPHAAAPPAVAPSLIRPEPAPEPYQVSTALVLSIGVTAIGLGIAAASVSGNRDPGAAAEGLVIAVPIAAIGPSVGHWYARDWWSRGLGFRLAGLAAVGLGANRDDLPGCEPGACDSDGTAAQVLLYGGALAFLFGTLDDLAATPRAVRDANRAHRLSLQPTIAPDRVGLAVSGAW